MKHRRTYLGLENPNAKHGFKGSRLENISKNMIQRCHNKNNPSYPTYGGRGIFVCDEWKNDRKSFFAWAVENGYKANLTIDRIDNDGGYKPSNCRWVDRHTQNTNTRLTKNKFRGVSKQGNRFSAYLNERGIGRVYLGSFDSGIEAALFRDQYILRYNLENKLNMLERQKD